MRWIFLTMLAALPAGAQDLGGAAQVYAVYCAGCHGPDGGGDGPEGDLLERPAPALTTLAQRNGGVFPRAEVVFQIDGRAEASSAHWDEMPNFGPLLEGDTVALKTASGQPILTTAAIADLVAWLEALQVE